MIYEYTFGNVKVLSDKPIHCIASFEGLELLAKGFLK